MPNRTVAYLSGASSVVNIARDPRWGRVPETYGECPTLTATIAIALNKALLGFPSIDAREPPAVLKTLPVMRHFAGYAGPDATRFTFDAHISEPDLRLTYLPVWKRIVRERATAGVMSAISALNGVPGIAHASLLTDKLRAEWGFDGYVVSDCDTFPALWEVWGWASGPEQAGAAALRAGGDINCGPFYASLYNATLRGLLEPSAVRAATRRAMTMRLRVGDLQPPASDPWRDSVPLSAVGSPEHAALTDDVVAGGTVLLHQRPGTLPLRPPSVSSAAASASAASRGSPPRGEKFVVGLVGPSADDPAIQAHTYHGTPAKWTTLRDALASELAEMYGGRAELRYAAGCAIDSANRSEFAAAEKVAAEADVLIYAGGLSAIQEEVRDAATLPTPPPRRSQGSAPLPQPPSYAAGGHRPSAHARHRAARRAAPAAPPLAGHHRRARVAVRGSAGLRRAHRRSRTRRRLTDRARRPALALLLWAKRRADCQDTARDRVRRRALPRPSLYLPCTFPVPSLCAGGHFRVPARPHTPLIGPAAALSARYPPDPPS